METSISEYLESKENDNQDFYNQKAEDIQNTNIELKKELIEKNNNFLISKNLKEFENKN